MGPIDVLNFAKAREVAMSVAVELPPDIERRLEALVAKSGRSRDATLREIIEHGIEDLEDYQEALEVMERVRRGEEEVLSGKDFWRGMDA
jgi:RHH-type rel operon transcriptional repressor/antitoxin RelB